MPKNKDFKKQWECVEISCNYSNYPKQLVECMGINAPKTITAIGNLSLLKNNKLALFCSSRCPGNIIISMHDYVKTLRESEKTVICGFHSSVEKECLRLLLRDKNPVIICPARAIHNMRIPSQWNQPLLEGRLLILSSFQKEKNRLTKDLARQRNEFVAALADKIIIAYASPGGNLESLKQKILIWQKPFLENEIGSASNF